MKTIFIEHIKYEHQLHKLFKIFDSEIDVLENYFNINNNDPDFIKTIINSLHLQYKEVKVL